MLLTCPGWGCDPAHSPVDLAHSPVDLAQLSRDKEPAHSSVDPAHSPVGPSTRSASRIQIRRHLYSSTPATVISDPCLNDGAGNGVKSGSEYVEDEVEDGGADEKDGLLKDSNRPQRKSKRRHPIVVALNRHLDLLKTVCPFIHKRRYINVIVERETIVFDTELMAFSA